MQEGCYDAIVITLGHRSTGRKSSCVFSFCSNGWDELGRSKKQSFLTLTLKNLTILLVCLYARRSVLCADLTGDLSDEQKGIQKIVNPCATWLGG